MFTVNLLLTIAVLTAGLGMLLEVTGVPEAISFLLFVGFCCAFWAASVNIDVIAQRLRKSTVPIHLGAPVKE